jgi:dihydroxy-acid dehydratase
MKVSVISDDFRARYLSNPDDPNAFEARPPAKLIQRGIEELPTMGDGRQSGTSGSPSILNASPEAAAGGNLAILKTNDMVRIDLKLCRVDVLISEDEITRRREEFAETGGYAFPESQTPWQQIQRSMVAQFDEGMILKPATKFRAITKARAAPRDNH